MFRREETVPAYTPEAYQLASRDASLGVGHLWFETQCPAYRTYNPVECICWPGQGVV